jgi:heme exporter protein D
MPDLGPHAVFIWAAYGVTFLAVAALVLVIVEDDRRQRRLLAELERQGITRRSARKPQATNPQVGKPQAANPRVGKPPAAKPLAVTPPAKPKASQAKSSARKPKS